MRAAQSAVIHRFSPTHKEAIAAYRFFHNEAISMEALQSALVDPTRPQVEGKHVLCIQDTSEINYSGHRGRLKRSDRELGPMTNKQDVGFFLHPSLVLDAESGMALGFADVQLWNRSWDQADKYERDYAKLPIEEKESYRWLASTEAARDRLGKASRVTIVADREADIYRLYSRLKGCDLVIRSRGDRRTSEGLLSDYLARLPVLGEITLKVRGNNGRKKRQARLQVRFSAVRLLKPKNNLKEEAPWVDLYGVEVLEKPDTVPSGEEPIHWCLLTTHVVSTLAEALVIVDYYKARWQIEQLFRLLKTESLEIEAAQLESGSALKKLCLMSLQVALVQLQLVRAREGTHRHDASLVWRPAALAFLAVVVSELEGKTEKQQCPHQAGTLAWTSWIIGRLGGWKGYASQSPPGPITMRRGLERFLSQFAGWQLAQRSQ